MPREASLDPRVAELVDAAFDRSWQFVRTDPELAHNDRDELRAGWPRASRDWLRTASGICGGSQTGRSVSCGASAARLSASEQVDSQDGSRVSETHRPRAVRFASHKRSTCEACKKARRGARSARTRARCHCTPFVARVS